MDATVDAGWISLSSEFNRPGGLYLRLRSRARNFALQCAGMIDSALAIYAPDPLLTPRVQFLYLHHIFADEQEPFRRLLKRLRKWASFISHAEAVQRVTSGAIDRPYITISFDDGLLTCIDAASILDEFGIRGCFFVCPEIIDRHGDDVFIKRWCHDQLHKGPVRVMSWKDIETLQAGGHEIGNHTATHANLASIGINELQDEVGLARDTLIRRLGDNAGRHFAWPYGELRHINDDAIDAIFQAGHESCVSAIRGAHAPGAPLKHRWLHRDQVLFNWPTSALDTLMRANSRRCMRLAS